MPQPKSIPPGKGGKPYGKRSKSLVYNMVQLNRTHYSLLKFTSKIVWYGLTVHIFSLLKNYKQNFQNYLSQANSSEFRKFHAIRPHSPRITQNSHILLTYSILCFRHLLRLRTLRFAHTACESCEFHTLRTIIKTYVIDFQISDHRQRTQENWSESTRFRSIRPPITRITRILPISQ